MNRFRRPSVWLCAAIGILLALAASATPPTTPFQYWSDPCGYAGIPSTYVGDISRMKEATAMLVPMDQFERRTDDPNYYRFKNPEANLNYPGSSDPWGGETPFVGANQTRFAQRGRTAFLIAPNIVATASHSPWPPGDPRNFNPYGFYVVFDVMKKETSPGICTEPDPEHIPATNVYVAKPVSQQPIGDALIADTMLEYRDGSYPMFVDYGAFYLDRAVPASRRYLRIRDHGHLAPYDHFAIISHPLRLTTKLLYGMTYAGDAAIPGHPEFTSPQFDDFYLIDGTSGAPVYNVDRDFVEVAASGGSGLGCTNIVAPVSVFNPNPYWEVRDACDATPREGEHVATGVNPGGISYLATLVPRPYLSVDPLDDVDYVLPINGTPSPAQTTYTATASPTMTGNTSISAYVATPPAGEPAFLQVGGYNASLAPGSSTAISVNVSVPTGTACGVYDRYMTVADLTHSFGDKMRHRFEIGMTDFSVTPDAPSDIFAVTAPSLPDGIAYTLTNERPTAVTVVASLGQSWLTFASGSPNSVTLAPAGQSGSSQSIIVKLGSNAYTFADGDYPFSVTFAAQGSCALNAPVQRQGVFHKGIVRYRKTLDALVFPPTPANDPITDGFTVAASFCVRDIKARFNSQSGGGSGVPWSIWAPSVRVYLDFSGATSASGQLWNLDALPSGWSVPSVPGPYSSVIETLLLDRYQNVPPTGIANLSKFINTNANGQWSFRLYDDGLQSVNTGILESWELELKGSPNCFGGA